MKKIVKNKTIYQITGTVILLLALVLLTLQLRANGMIVEFLNAKIPPHIQLNYDDLYVNVIAGDVTFSNVRCDISLRGSDAIHTNINIKKLKIDDLSYWQFFFKNTIQTSDVLIDEPLVTYQPSKHQRKDSTKSKGVVNLLKKIVVKQIRLRNGKFLITHKDSSQNHLIAESINFELNNSATGPDQIKKKIPITYDSYTFSTGHLFVDTSKFETVTAASLMINESNAVLQNLALKSKHSKTKLSQLSPTEIDHINLKIASSTLDDIDFGFEDEQFFFTCKLLDIADADLKIYRDKLIDDDLSIKKMYSRMIRELPIKLKLDKIQLTNSKVQYEEQTAYETQAGLLFFDNINAQITHLGNGFDKTQQTKCLIKGHLMGVSPTTLGYHFNMNDSDDAFTMTASLFNLNGKAVNSFLKPNLNAEVQGIIDELYLTTSGNAFAATGEMKMKYKDLEFNLLKKDRLKINKLLSAIGNLFINDGSDTDAKGYRHGTINVERDPTKSFFNHVWVTTQDGLLSTIAGNGEKE